MLWSPVLQGNLLPLDKYFKIHLGEKYCSFLKALPRYHLLVHRNHYQASKELFFWATKMRPLPLSELAASGQCSVHALKVPERQWHWTDLSTSSIWHAPWSCLSKQGKGEKACPSLSPPAQWLRTTRNGSLTLRIQTDISSSQREGVGSAKKVSMLSHFWGWGKGWGHSYLYSKPCLADPAKWLGTRGALKLAQQGVLVLRQKIIPYFISLYLHWKTLVIFHIARKEKKYVQTFCIPSLIIWAAWLRVSDKFWLKW